MDDLDTLINSVRAQTQQPAAPQAQNPAFQPAMPARDPLDDVIDSVRQQVQPQLSPAQPQLSPGATFAGGYNLPNQAVPGPMVAAPPPDFQPSPLMQATNLPQPAFDTPTQQGYQAEAADAKQQAYQNWQRQQVNNARYQQDPSAAFQADYQGVRAQMPPVSIGQEASAVGGRIRAKAAETLTGIGAAASRLPQFNDDEGFLGSLNPEQGPNFAENLNAAARQLAQEQQAQNPVRTAAGVVASEGALIGGKIAAGVAAGPAAPAVWGGLGMGDSYNRAANEMDRQVREGKATPEEAQRTALNAAALGGFIGTVAGMIPGFGKVNPSYAQALFRTVIATGGQSVADDLVARGYEGDPKKIGQILQDGATAAAFGAVIHGLFHLFSLAPGDPLAAEGPGIPQKVVDMARERWDLYQAGKMTREEALRPAGATADQVREALKYFRVKEGAQPQTPEPQPNTPAQTPQEPAPVVASGVKPTSPDAQIVPKTPAPPSRPRGLVGQPPGPTAVGGFSGQTPINQPPSITDPFGERNAITPTRNLRADANAAAGQQVAQVGAQAPAQIGQEGQGQTVRQEGQPPAAPGRTGAADAGQAVSVPQPAVLNTPDAGGNGGTGEVGLPPLSNLRPTIAEATMNELKRTAEHFGISPDDTRMNLIRQLREIEVEQRRMGTLANDQSLFDAVGSPPPSPPPSDWIGQLNSEIVKAGGKVKRRYAKDVVEPAQPEAPLHYSGISLDEVRRLTGLSEDSPALHNTGLPRATDVQVGQTLSIPKGSPGANSGLTKEKGKTAKVIAVWRTAGAKERDQLLHLTLQADTGEQYGVGGKAAERYKADVAGTGEGRSTPAENSPQRPGKEPWQMTSKEFEQSHFQHIDLRSQGDEASKQTRESIQREGFRRGFNVNATRIVPADAKGFQARYRAGPGKDVYLIPQSAVVEDKNGPKVKEGWKPTDANIVRVKEGQSLHHAAVEQAIAQGKAVPPEVLAEYPDLKSAPASTGGTPSRGFEKMIQSAMDTGDERTIAKLVNRSVAGRKYFQQQTGIKLPTNVRDAMDAIDSWAKGAREKSKSEGEKSKLLTPKQAVSFDNPKMQADMGGTLLSKPPGNPGPPAAPPTAPEEPAPSFLDKVKGGLHRLKDSAARFSGEMFPTVTRLSRPAGEAWARAVSSDIYAKQASPTITNQIITGDKKMPKEQKAELEKLVGAILTQDRLDFIRDNAEDPNAVHTLIGAQNSPFKTQQDFNAAMGRPEVRDAIQRALEWAKGEPEENFKVAQGIAPDEELPGRGRRFDIGISIKAVEPGDAASKDAVIMGATSPRGNLSNPLLKKSKFGRKATGLGQAYEVNLGALVENIMKETGKADLVRAYDALVKGGIAKWGKPGEKVVEGGRAWTGFDVQRRTLLIPDKPPIMQSKRLFVRPEIASEIRQGLNVDSSVYSPTLTKVSNVLNRTALAGVSEAFFHLGNQLTALMRSPSMGSRIKDWERKFGQVMLDDPRVAAQLMDLARIGALKPGQEGSMKNPLNWMGKVIELFDHTGRLVLDDEWQSMRDKGQVPDTETSRRDYLNAFGQYNHRAQHRMVALARAIGIGPFATAGTNFYAKGVQSLGMSPGVKATSNATAAKMRTVIFLRYLMVAAALPFLLNWARKKKTGAGTGVPPWAIRLDDSADGKVRYIDMLSATPWKRGLNALGLLPAYNEYQKGATVGESVGVGIKAIPKAFARPFEGPVAKFGITAATGYDAEGYKKSEDTGSPWENLKAAAKGANPLVDATTGGTASAFGPFKVTTGGPADEGKESRAYRLARTLARSGDDSMTTEEKAKIKLRFELIDQVRKDYKAGRDAVEKAASDGLITDKDFTSILDRADTPPLVDTVKHLTLPRAMRVFEIATPDEQEELRPLIEHRIDFGNLTDAERAAADKRMEAIPRRIKPLKAAG